MLNLILYSLFTLVSLNCENLFDCEHDSLKSDMEWLPNGANHWTRMRYWKKLNNIGQEIIACGETEEGWILPDLVALCEVENDSVMIDLTRRSLLRNARYEYVMTDSPDPRGVDVALLYSPFSFALLNSRTIRVEPLKDMHPTRDILYASGLVAGGDTLHVFVIHAPSRSGGERETRPHRLQVARQLCVVVDSIRSLSPTAKIIVAGDFNDYGRVASLQMLSEHELTDISLSAKGKNGAKGTYRYQGEWGSLDHVFVSPTVKERLVDITILDAPFLLEMDMKYGGKKPRRTYLGPRYLGGFSDHLPLVARFSFQSD